MLPDARTSSIWLRASIANIFSLENLSDLQIQVACIDSSTNSVTDTELISLGVDIRRLSDSRSLVGVERRQHGPDQRSLFQREQHSRLPQTGQSIHGQTDYCLLCGS